MTSEDVFASQCVPLCVCVSFHMLFTAANTQTHTQTHTQSHRSHEGSGCLTIYSYNHEMCVSHVCGDGPLGALNFNSDVQLC